MNTLTELIEVFEVWDSQLKDADLDQVDGFADEIQQESATSSLNVGQNFEPRGM